MSVISPWANSPGVGLIINPLKHRTMIRDFNFPKNFELEAELSEMLEELSARIALDSVFLSELQTEGDLEYRIVTFIAEASIDPIPPEVLKLTSSLGKEHPEFRFKIYTENQAETGLFRGSLYFVEHCCLGSVLYASLESRNILDFGGISLKSMHQRAVSYQNAESRKIKVFTKTANDLIRAGNHAMATFNMHQAFELSFRFVEQMCIGTGRISHSIIGHINYCKPFFPTLSPFSGYPEQESRELLMLLEYSYSGARYGEGFEVTEAQALAMRAGLDRFLKEVESIFQKHCDSCRALMERQEPEPMDCGPEPTADKAEERDARSLLEEIKKLKKRNFDTLIPNSPERKHYYLQVKTRGYEENNYMIANFIQLCIMALETDWDMSINNVEPEYCIREVLGLVLNMLPYSEMEFLDEINKLVKDEVHVE